MLAKDYWQIFMETGAPEAYLSYRNALTMEANHVPDHEGAGPASDGLQ